MYADAHTHACTLSVYITACNFFLFFFLKGKCSLPWLSTVVFLSWLFGSLTVGLPAIFDAATYKNRREEQKALGAVSHSSTELLFLLDPPPHYEIKQPELLPLSAAGFRSERMELCKN